MIHISAKEPHLSAKEPYLSAKKPYFSAKEPYLSAKEPHLSAKEPYLSAKKPYLSAKEPHLSAKEPYISRELPQHTFLTRRGSMYIHIHRALMRQYRALLRNTGLICGLCRPFSHGVGAWISMLHMYTCIYLPHTMCGV